MLLPQKYESIFDVSSEGPSEVKLFTKLPDEGPSLETSKVLSYFSGRNIPCLCYAVFPNKHFNDNQILQSLNKHETTDYSIKSTDTSH